MAATTSKNGSFLQSSNAQPSNSFSTNAYASSRVLHMMVRESTELPSQAGFLVMTTEAQK